MTLNSRTRSFWETRPLRFSPSRTESPPPFFPLIAVGDHCPAKKTARGTEQGVLIQPMEREMEGGHVLSVFIGMLQDTCIFLGLLAHGFLFLSGEASVCSIGFIVRSGLVVIWVRTLEAAPAKL